jgi:biotin operon repressor
VIIDEEHRDDLVIDEEDHLTHYGILRKSGRYPWGSGETPHERANSFLGYLKSFRKEGMTDTEIAHAWGMTTSQLRDTVSIANEAKKTADIAQAMKLKYDVGMSNVAIGKKMGIGESSVRLLLKQGEADRQPILDTTAEMLRQEVASKKYIDVGRGVEVQLHISEKKLKTAVSVLKEEGYSFHYIQVPQLGTGKKTNIKVLSAPGTTYAEVSKNKAEIKQIRKSSRDGGRSYDEILPPISIDSKRVKVRYAEEGGTDADGTIYVRPGVKDVSLGSAKYAQVRIAVDGSHYLKGMALYRDDLPAGVDLVFNTNKKNTGNKLDAMKPMKKDPDDPFGSMIADQLKEMGPDGKLRPSSVMNIVNQEGNWDEWSKTLSSQMLSKQKPSLADHQLALTREAKQREFDTIMSLTNETVKKHLLEKFADETDSAAVHLKAAHLPRQKTKVILPINSMKETEIYAPSFRDGEKVVLVRFPHGHISEIPELTVNNRHPEAKKILGNAPDAVGIHHAVAERLSGADFDGDTVLVIPNNLGKVRNKAQLEELKGFDPQSEYKGYPGMPQMTSQQKGSEMGKVSNLITDMTALGAPDAEIARALKHSMVVIDAEKHGLDYKRSAIENGIPALKKKYQGGATRGAATIVSRAKSTERVLDRKPRSAKEGGPIDRATGKLVYTETGAEYTNGNPKMIKSTKLAETHDAHTLVSDHQAPIEKIYADHSNALKKMANDARLATLDIKGIVRSPSAAKAYEKEVKDLEASLQEALRNAPYERQAQLLGNAIYQLKKESNPDLDDADLKKLKAKAIKEARLRVGAEKQSIDITPKQWEAIQAGAISKTQLEHILDNTDVDKIKELATPRDKPVMSVADKNRALLLLRDDKYSLADVADQLGVSVSTLTAAMRGDAA